MEQKLQFSSQREALEELKEHSHSWFTTDQARAFLKVFPSAKDPCQRFTVDEKDFKGLKIAGKKHGDTVYGADAADLAECIADSIGVDTDILSRISGRGARLRIACELAMQKVNEFPPSLDLQNGVGKTAGLKLREMIVKVVPGTDDFLVDAKNGTEEKALGGWPKVVRKSELPELWERINTARKTGEVA